MAKDIGCLQHLFALYDLIGEDVSPLGGRAFAKLQSINTAFAQLFSQGAAFAHYID